jgi:prepilin-type processing-associated H-X9-DG protein
MPRRRTVAGFTLVELLVMIGIIALLIAILLPVLSSARRSARDVQCASNIRQLCAALMNYAGEWKGLFPPNGDYFDSAGRDVAVWWCDEERIGPFVSGGNYYDNGFKPTTSLAKSGLIARGAIGGLFVCPNDEGAARSYAMNVRASCVWYNTWNGHIPHSQQLSHAQPFRGPNVRKGSQTILVIEAFSVVPTPYGCVSPPACGPWFGSSPPLDFGALPPLQPTGRYVGHYWGEGARHPDDITEITYAKHRRSADGGTGDEPKGRLNVGYCDGHVGMKRHTDLVDLVTINSTFDSLWSPDD